MEDKYINYITNRINEFDKLLFNNNSIAIISIGIPGSGKSSTKKNIISNLQLKHLNFFTIDPDIIINDLFNNNESYRRVSNDINDKIYEIAISKKFNIIYDGNGKDFDEWHYPNVIKKLKHTYNYKIYLSIIISNLDIVKPRIQKRYEKIGRNVDINTLTYIYNKLNISIPKYLKLKCNDIDGIYVYNNYKHLKLLYQYNCSNKELLCNLNKNITHLKPNHIYKLLDKKCDISSKSYKKSSKKSMSNPKKTKKKTFKKTIKKTI